MSARMVLCTMVTLVLTTSFIRCTGRPPVVRDQPLNTPEARYLRGQRCLMEGDDKEAFNHFEMARDMEPDYAPAYEGLGLVELGRGHLPEAQRYFQLGLQRDETFAPLYVGMGRAFAARQIHREAIGQFQLALGMDPQNADAYYYLGRSYLNLGQHSQAEEAFKKALDRNPSHLKANQEWERLAHARSSPDGLPEEYVTIIKKPLICKAEFAALLSHQLPLEAFCRSDVPGPVAVDLAECWARREIQQAVACGLMPLSSDKEFHPRQKITRRDVAEAIEKILSIAMPNSHLTEPFLDQSSPFADVAEDHESFGAIMLATSRGIMKPRTSARFAPEETLTGYEAIQIVDALRKWL